MGEGGGSHIGKGLSWYIGPVLHDLLRRESDLWVVRAEACEHDLEGAIRWLRDDDTLDVLPAVWKSTSELGSHGNDVASMAWGVRDLFPHRSHARGAKRSAVCLRCC